jgi:hypothetical protein
MVEFCERDQQAEGIYHIEAITGHRKTKKGTYEVQVSWSTGEITWEPMRAIFQDDPISISVYAKENALLNTDGWRSCKRYVSNAKKLSWMANQATHGWSTRQNSRVCATDPYTNTDSKYLGTTEKQ